MGNWAVKIAEHALNCGGKREKKESDGLKGSSWTARSTASSRAKWRERGRKGVGQIELARPQVGRNRPMHGLQGRREEC